MTNIRVVKAGAAWCKPCRVYQTAFHEASKHFSNGVSFEHLDVDAEADKAKEFGVEQYPTTLVFREGQLIDSHVGVMRRDELIAFVQQHTGVAA